jgi:hypothetical protein
MSRVKHEEALAKNQSKVARKEAIKQEMVLEVVARVTRSAELLKYIELNVWGQTPLRIIHPRRPKSFDCQRRPSRE